MINFVFTECEGGYWKRALMVESNEKALLEILDEQEEYGRSSTTLVGSRVLFPISNLASDSLIFHSIMFPSGIIWDTSLGMQYSYREFHHFNMNSSHFNKRWRSATDIINVELQGAVKLRWAGIEHQLTNKYNK